MKPLKVALLHTKGPRTNEARMVGIWSYAVPEFDVTHFNVGKNFVEDSERFKNFDVIWVEDKSCYGWLDGDAALKCYYVTDSTLSKGHYKSRFRAAKNYDLVFVDWDMLERFADVPGEVKRCGYCVNDRLMMDYGEQKTVDVYFPCIRKGPGGTDRAALDEHLKKLCADYNLVYDNSIRPGIDYAMAMNRSRLVVQIQRTATTRAHRTFDAMACRSCLVSDPLPEVSDEYREAGTHYLEFTDTAQLDDLILSALGTDKAHQVAETGHQMVMERHTWQARATQLRETLDEWIA